MPARLTEEDFGTIFQKVPRVCVDYVLLDRVKRKVLLIRRGIPPFKGWLGIGGGSVYVDEHPIDALRRHAREDLGIEIAVLGLSGIHQYVDDSGNYPPNNIIICYAVITLDDPQPSQEAIDLWWVDYDCLPEKMGWCSKEEVREAIRIWG